MRRGFSLTEILTTIVILAVLAAIAIPGFSKTRAKHDTSQAVTYLRAIRLAEKMHYAKNGSYAANPPTGCAAMTPLANAAAINSCLGTEIADGKYTFSLAAPTASTFTVTATKVGGTAADTITLDEAGVFTKGGAAYSPS